MIAEQQGLTRTSAHVRRWLKRPELTYHRTSATLRHKQDPAVNTVYRADLETLEKGAAVAGYGPDFMWDVESESVPLLRIDDAVPVAATRLLIQTLVRSTSSSRS